MVIHVLRMKARVIVMETEEPSCLVATPDGAMPHLSGRRSPENKIQKRKHRNQEVPLGVTQKEGADQDIPRNGVGFDVPMLCLS